jgi:oligoribonuclease NrnB/cAMP/cGMP phosphodiesterase (DHH superfamily)
MQLSARSDNDRSHSLGFFFGGGGGWNASGVYIYPLLEQPHDQRGRIMTE